VIVTQRDPSSIFDLLFPFLSPSCPFVVFSQYNQVSFSSFFFFLWSHFQQDPTNQPLAELYHKVLKSGEGLHLDLTESWFREYQVLQGRTHPFMKMSSASGFIFSGIKVLDDSRSEKKDDGGESQELKKPKIETKTAESEPMDVMGE
jgi:tRNA (adenine-N(1)-)-methyltransferase non-catalytic subunit